ncbi:hypothetical protein NN561_008346 [Cricetulus griseus]
MHPASPSAARAQGRKFPQLCLLWAGRNVLPQGTLRVIDAPSQPRCHNCPRNGALGAEGPRKPGSCHGLGRRRCAHRVPHRPAQARVALKGHAHARLWLWLCKVTSFAGLLYTV